ncbi:TonB-dependent receptor, partial [Phenylobacterium sp.]|uniref:TonB-dependent receptor n=1 Tax=Phenylobacterium sp. TaxID=1871053 RepID=UPI00286C9C67
WLDSDIDDDFGSRRFNDQSDYVFNVGFIHDIPTWGAAFGATYRKQGDAFGRIVGEEVTTSYGADLEVFVEKRFGKNFVLRLTGGNLLNASKDEVFNKFTTFADQRARDFDEYEVETEEAGPVFQLVGRVAFSGLKPSTSAAHAAEAPRKPAPGVSIRHRRAPATLPAGRFGVALSIRLKGVASAPQALTRPPVRSGWGMTMAIEMSGLRALLMASVAAGGVLLGSPALAQDAVGAEGAEVGELVVIGRPIAESEAAALQIQRESPSLVSVIAADSVGRLPDQNIAFAIGRLSGVAIERDQGQARYVNLRGAKINWTTLSFDGLSVVSPEGRASRFDNIPSALASQIVVSKAVTPDMPGDTVAGNVNIITRSAFDFPGMHFAAKAAAGYVALGGGEETDLSLLFSNRFLDDKLGLVLQASKYTRNMVTDNFETDPWQTAGAGRDARPGSETRRWAREYENKLYRLTRANIGGSAKLEYQFDDNNQVFASSIYTDYQDEELRSNYIFRFDNGATTATGACPAVPAPQTTSGFADVCNGNTPDKGIVYGVQLTPNFNSLESSEYTWTNTLGGEHNFSGWDLSWRLNYTQTEDGQNAPSRSNFASPATLTDRPTVEYDFTDDDNHTVRLYRTILTGTVRSRGAREFSIDAFPIVPTGTAISTTDAGDPTFAYTGKFDAGRDLELMGSPFSVKFGGLYSVRTKKHEEKTYSATSAQLTAAGRAFTFDMIRNNKPFQGDIALGYDFDYFSKSALDNFAGELLRAGVLRLQDTSSNYYRVQEKILSGYAMGTLERDWGNIVAGVRVERTENTGEAFVTLGGVRQIITAENDDVLVFPSAHINWDLNDEMKVRVGVTTGASRPDYDELRPNFSFNDSTQTISGGNPDAGPEKAIGVDAYFEWYMQPRGYFSFGVYYKDLKDVLFSAADVFGSPLLNSGGVDRSGYTLTTLRNGGDGYIRGLEVAYSQSIESYTERMGLPDWVGGFGFQGNITLNDSEVTVPRAGTVPERKIPLTGSSDLVYNASIYYEKYGLSARLAYQFRTEWGQSVGEYQVLNGAVVPVTNGDVYWDDDEELDLSIRYSFNEHYEWFFDAVNLTNDAGRRYGADPGHPIEHETFGRRYIMGVRVNF